jgi:Histidine kinase-, DNA gyrase B-, and HSP90-like ATPase
MSNKQFSPHEFGPGIVKELATKLYRNPIAVYREAISNALDAMIPYSANEQRIEIFTNVPPDGDIIIEDWGTGIEDYNTFKIISPGKKVIRNEVSSYEKLNEKIIGQKGMGKLSFLNLSEIGTVEFYSNNEKVGMKVIMTWDLKDGFYEEFMNSDLALSHHGVKVVIKHAKRSIVQENKLKDYISKTFAIRIARGAKIFVNGIQIHKPDGFNSSQYKLFELTNGSKVFGNLNNVERPKPNNIEIFVKRVFVDSKEFDYKVEGWLNCDSLELETSRDGIYEGSELYVEFIEKLMKYLEKNFDKKSENKDKDKEIKSGKEIAKMFVDILKSIHNLYPEMTNPFLSGNLSNEKGFGNFSHPLNDINSPCVEQKGIVDNDNSLLRIIGKPIGNGKGNRNGNGESTFRIKNGNGKVLSPSNILFTDNGQMPQLKVDVIGVEGKPVIFFNAPNRLVINSKRPSSKILLEAKSKDLELKSRVLPLLVRAGIDAFPGSSDMSKEEWFMKYDAVLDNVFRND